MVRDQDECQNCGNYIDPEEEHPEEFCSYQCKDDFELFLKIQDEQDRKFMELTGDADRLAEEW